MGLNWSKQRDRDLANKAATDGYDTAAMLSGEFETGPSKAELRAMADKACASARIRRLPTRCDVKCSKCGHAGRIFVRDNQRGKPFKCSSCGNKQRLP